MLIGVVSIVLCGWYAIQFGSCKLIIRKLSRILVVERGLVQTGCILVILGQIVAKDAIGRVIGLHEEASIAEQLFIRHTLTCGLPSE